MLKKGIIERRDFIKLISLAGTSSLLVGVFLLTELDQIYWQKMV
jgi:hypothetical protein